MATFRDRLEEALRLRDMSPAELSRLSGVNEGAISQYRSGAYKASQRSLDRLAQTLNVSIPWLMGADVPESPPSPTLPPNCKPIRMKQWPVLGATACGQPIHKELSDRTVEAPDDIKADFAFRCVGDSMIGARIMDGDWVFVRSQPEVENGQIAVVRIEDEYTLKRVYRGSDYLELRAENPKCPPLLYRENEMNRCEIIGLAVELLSRVV